MCQWIRAHFLSLARSKLRLCSANHRTGYFSNLACDWLSIVWAYSEQETENRPRSTLVQKMACHQAIIWTSAVLLSIGPLATHFSEILTKIQNFSFRKMHLKLSSAKRRPFCPGGELMADHRLQLGDLTPPLSLHQKEHSTFLWKFSKVSSSRKHCLLM